jgi:hypothetical protein
MTTMVTRPMLLKSGDIINEGILHLQSFDSKERKIRAAKIWGFMWLLALLSLPIIVAHFVLVPGFLIAGPVMPIVAIDKWKCQAMLLVHAQPIKRR